MGGLASRIRKTSFKAEGGQRRGNQGKGETLEKGRTPLNALSARSTSFEKKNDKERLLSAQTLRGGRLWS